MNTDPYDEAFDAFHAEPTQLSFHQTVAEHAHGEFSYVVRTPNVFVCAREMVESSSDIQLVDDIWVSHKSTHLHVTIVAGELRALVALIPSYIKTISFQKHGYHVHRMSMGRLRARLKA